MLSSSIRSFSTAAFTCVILLTAGAAGGADEEESPVFGVRIPDGYRDWPVISVAHEEGNLNDIRAVVGNDIAVKAYRDGIRPFPDGAIIGRLAWKYVSSAQNNEVFGRVQSYVAGPPTNIQFSVKDSKKYAATDGWGYGQFEDGKPNRNEALHKACYPCHALLPRTEDFVFTHYAQ